MSTKAGTMGFSGRPALFTFWIVTVSVLAAAALILSTVALNVAGRGDRSVTSVEGSGTRKAESNGSLDEAAVALSPLKGSLIIAYDRALRQRDRLLKEWDRPGVPARFLDEAVVALWPLKESLIIAYDRALRQRDRLLKEWDRTFAHANFANRTPWRLGSRTGVASCCPEVPKSGYARGDSRNPLREGLRRDPYRLPGRR